MMSQRLDTATRSVFTAWHSTDMKAVPSNVMSCLHEMYEAYVEEAEANPIQKLRKMSFEHITNLRFEPLMPVRNSPSWIAMDEEWSVLWTFDGIDCGTAGATLDEAISRAVEVLEQELIPEKAG